MKKRLLAIGLGCMMALSCVPVKAEEVGSAEATQQETEQATAEMGIEVNEKGSLYGTPVYTESNDYFACATVYDTDNNGTGDLLVYSKPTVDATGSALAIDSTHTYDVTKVIVENGVTGLSSNIFQSFDKLETVVLSDSVTYINSSAFENCIRLKNVTFGANMSSIGNSVFENCTSLETINIPKFVETIYYDTFAGCTNLKSVTVDSDNRYFSSVDGVLYTKDKKTLAFYPSNHASTYVIPEGTTKIGAYAFQKGYILKTLTIPKSVTSIGYLAFPSNENKDGLTDIYYLGTKRDCSNMMYVGYSQLDYTKVHLYQAIYRLYSPVNYEHLYTTDENEVKTLVNRNKWSYEGVSWFAPDQGKPVYRLYNPGLQNHLYTTDNNEIKVLTETAGWQIDNNGNPLFYSDGDVAVYRLYNQALRGLHLWTNDKNEYDVLPGQGWKQEGTVLYGKAKGDPEYKMPY